MRDEYLEIIRDLREMQGGSMERFIELKEEDEEGRNE
jgi:hypothetical protein